MSEHSFNIYFAKKYGLPCAVLIKHIDFWLAKNKSNKYNYIEDKYWTYMSVTGFTKFFDYLTYDQIRYAIKKLIQNNIIVTGNFNKMKYDKTSWYTFTDSFVNDNASMLQFSLNDVVKLPDGSGNNTEPIPDSNTDNKTDSNTDINFNIFWNEYPKKQGKAKAQHAFKKMIKKMPDIETLIDILKTHKIEWKDYQFIPLPATWLNGERWNDEIKTTAIKETKTKHCTKCGSVLYNGTCNNPICESKGGKNV
jgi:hypothetical protein